MKDYIEFKTKIGKSGGTSTSYKTTIPKEILSKMEVTTGDYITWRVYDGNKIITILSSGETSKKPKNQSSNIDETTKKQTKTKNKEPIQSISTDNKEYTIELLKNPYLQIRVINNNTKKQVTTLGASKREKSQIQTIITLLQPCNTEEEIREVLTEYR